MKTKRLISLAMVLLLCLTIAPIQAAAAVAPTSVQLSAASAALGVGETKALKATVAPSGAAQTVTWSSGSTAVATVSSKGVVTAKKAGAATITATTANGKKASCKVTVNAAPTGVKLNASKVTLDITKTYTLKATLSPSGAVGAVSYSSGNTAVATVDASGKITAKKAGTAVITVKTYNNKTATCTVTVKPTAPTGIKFSAGTVNIGLKETRALTTAYTPSYATSSRKFKSSNTAVVTVDSAGKVTGKKAGNATITVTTGNGKTATCKVTVKAAPTSMKLNVTSRTLGVGQTYTLKPTLSSGSAGAVSYSSNNTAVATVNAAGKITPKKTGSAVITAKTYNGKPAKCTVKVIAAPTGVKLSKTSIEMGVGQKWKPTATISPSGAATGYTWTSSNTKAVTVDSTGNLTAKATGSATITLTTYNGKTAKCTVTVRVAPSGVTITPASAAIGVGQSTTLTAKLTTTGVFKTAGAVSWKSANTKFATVDANGKVTGKAVGTAVITATTYNGKTKTCTVTVAPAPTAVKLSGTTALYTGQIVTLKAALTPTNAQAAISWSSDKPAIASVDANGKVTAKAAGTAVITAKTYNSKSGSITVTVQTAPSSVSLKLSRTDLLVGETAASTATIAPKGAVNKNTFKSSDATVATVDSSGKVTAKKVGTAVITVTTVNGKTASVTVNVCPPATGIKLTNVNLGLGVTKEYPAANITMTPANAIRRNTFTSSDPSVAKVNADGSITTLKNGSVTITAKIANGKTASATLTVMVPAGKDPLTNAVFPVADIVGYYNYCANATKYTKETVNVSGWQYFKATTTVGSGGLNLDLGDIADDPDLNGETLSPFGGPGVIYEGKNFGVDFIDGVQFAGSKTLASMLPVNGESYMSALKPEYVNSATCTAAAGGTYKIAITVKNETLAAGKPSLIYNSFYLSDIDTSSFEGLEGFDEEGFTVSAPSLSFTGGKIAATTNSNSLLNAVRLDAKITFQISISSPLLPFKIDMKSIMSRYDDLTFKF